MIGLNCMRYTSTEFMWEWKTYLANDNLLFCFLTPIQHYVNITGFTGNTRPAKFNKYSCVIKNLYQDNNFVWISMIFLAFSWYHQNNLAKINRKCLTNNNLWSESKVSQGFMSLGPFWTELNLKTAFFWVFRTYICSNWESNIKSNIFWASETPNTFLYHISSYLIWNMSNTNHTPHSCLLLPNFYGVGQSDIG